MLDEHDRGPWLAESQEMQRLLSPYPGSVTDDGPIRNLLEVRQRRDRSALFRDKNSENLAMICRLAGSDVGPRLHPQGLGREESNETNRARKGHFGPNSAPNRPADR